MVDVCAYGRDTGWASVASSQETHIVTPSKTASRWRARATAVRLGWRRCCGSDGRSTGRAHELRLVGRDNARTERQIISTKLSPQASRAPAPAPAPASEKRAAQVPPGLALALGIPWQLLPNGRCQCRNGGSAALAMVNVPAGLISCASPEPVLQHAEGCWVSGHLILPVGVSR